MGLYDQKYPAGPGPRPLYPSPVGIYTPVGSPVTPMGAAKENDNKVFPPAQAKTMGTLQDKPAPVGPWNKMVEGYQSPGQSDQDTTNGKTTVYSASVDRPVKPLSQAQWVDPETGKATSGYYQQSGEGARIPGGSVMSIPKESMMNISPETSRALSGARQAAAARGDFEAISNSYGGDFANGKYAGGGGGQAPDPMSDLISDVRGRLAQSANDTSFTGRVTYRNMFNRLTELTKLQQKQQEIGIQGGQLGVQQREAAVRENTLPILKAHSDAAKALANNQFMATLPKAQREMLENAILGGNNPQAQSGYRKGVNAIKGEVDATKVGTQFQTTLVPNDVIDAFGGYNVGGIPGIPTQPVNPNQYGPQPLHR